MTFFFDLEFLVPGYLTLQVTVSSLSVFLPIMGTKIISPACFVTELCRTLRDRKDESTLRPDIITSL